MANQIKRLAAPGQLPSSAGALYTAPAGTYTTIKKVTLTNSTAGVVTATLYLVPSGGSAGVTNIILSARPVAAGATRECPELMGHVLGPGDAIHGLASAGTSLTYHLSGVENS